MNDGQKIMANIAKSYIDRAITSLAKIKAKDERIQDQIGASIIALDIISHRIDRLKEEPVSGHILDKE